ncbi:hypothetical protein EMPG_12218, partial [Blastomyces silverae]
MLNCQIYRKTTKDRFAPLLSAAWCAQINADEALIGTSASSRCKIHKIPLSAAFATVEHILGTDVTNHPQPIGCGEIFDA